MKISITSGSGTGPTELAAFDDALMKAGTANFNLIVLSSMIPPGSEVVVSKDPVVPPGDWGDKLYVVMAEQRTSQHHQEAWAGIGWVQNAQTGKGMFVEHHGHSEEHVTDDIKATLKSLMAGRPDEEFGEIHMQLCNAKCIGEPVCALVVAAFESSGWSSR
ncbi:MAG TPA: pyruvoyl-dependent arginine decarboxylase [Candidatus Saccharimonadales bacterium]|nr:pyruvoyl-dependent arginine decarboxylase [Candidatus Saccharimonadales bacterium]